jgi:2-deoxy-D-gluconate 3-dehydrogenase
LAVLSSREGYGFASKIVSDVAPLNKVIALLLGKVGGIVAMTRALAVAWASDNIQVNAILPGWIDTDLTRKARVELDGLNERVLSRTPIGRWGRPEDLQGTAIYLATAASNFVTGVALPVDGGYSVSV